MKRAQAVVVLVSMSGAIALFGPAQAADPPRLTQPVNATKFDLEPARTYTSPSILGIPAIWPWGSSRQPPSGAG